MATRSGADTPILRVSRPVSACSRCRAAKVKCDGKLPACTACEKLGRRNECSSANDQFAKGKERSYVASLESRIERLEKRLMHNKNRQSLHAALAQQSEPAPVAADTMAFKGTPRAGAAKRQEASDMDDLVSDFGFLAVNATSRDFYGFTSGMAFASLVLTPATLEEIPLSLARSLPARHTANTVIQHYLDKIFVFLPFFSETALFASLNALYHRQARDWDHWVVYMVLAVANASLSRRRGDPEHQNAVGFASAALTKADRVLHPGSVAGVQAILFLVQFAMFLPDHFDSWYLIGVASRTMVDLGLHQDSRKQSHGPDIELRRRVFYTVYTLDRYISMVLRRAFSFSDDSVSVQFPTSSPTGSHAPLTWGSELQAQDPTIHLLRVRRLQSTWYQELFQSDRTPYPDPTSRLSAIQQEFHDWFAATPSTLPEWTKSVFELELSYSYVYVMSPSRRVKTVDFYQSLFTFEHCLSFADKMTSALSDPDTRLHYPPHETLRIYFVGDRIIDTLWTNQDKLLDPTKPLVTAVSGDVANPRYCSSQDVIPRSIKCIRQILDMLDEFGARWSRSTLLRTIFEKKSATMLATLHHLQRSKEAGVVEAVVPSLP